MDESVRQVVEVAANVDDVTGEVAGHAIAQLLDDGALDAWATPITMKKGRPALTIALLAVAEDRDRLARRLIELTGSFGVRYRPWDRLVLDRRHQTVQTTFGPVRVKVGSLGGDDVAAKVEFDDAAALADSAGVPVRVVIDAANAAYRQGGGS